jgi:hypothetical protein
VRDANCAESQIAITNRDSQNLAWVSCSVCKPPSYQAILVHCANADSDGSWIGVAYLDERGWQSQDSTDGSLPLPFVVTDWTDLPTNRHPGWIPLNYASPDPNRSVLVLFCAHPRFSSHWIGSAFLVLEGWQSQDSVELDLPLLHHVLEWMPMPLPPAG